MDCIYNIDIQLTREEAYKLIELQDYLRHNTEIDVKTILLYFANNKDLIVEFFEGGD